MAKPPRGAREGRLRAERADRSHRDDFDRICGPAAVAAVFDRAPDRVERLFFVQDMRAFVEAFCRTLSRARKPYREVGPEELARIAGTALHGGVVAVVRPRPVLSFDPVAACRPENVAPLLLVLDGVGNPHNLGAIARTAAFLGLDRMVISDHPAQAGPSDAAYRVAEGGLDHVQLYRASRLPTVLRRLGTRYRVVSAALGRGRPPELIGRERPIALVLGNEQDGLDAATLAACTDMVTIPGSGRVQSLNVASAAAILIYGLTRS